MLLMEEFLTVKEVARLLKLSEETVKKMLQRGDLPGRKYGRQWRVRRSDLDAKEAEKKNTLDQES